MRLLRKSLVYSLFIAILLLGGCGDEKEPVTAVALPQEPTPASITAATSAPERAPQSPLASPLVSPLGTPQPSLTSQQFARPDRPYLLFYSSKEGKPGWYLHDLTQDAERWAPFQEIPGFTVRSAVWVSDLSAFIVQMVDGSGQTDLYLVDFAGAIITPITRDQIDEGDAWFSPVSEEFVFVCVQNDLDICKSRADGMGWTNLTNIRTREASPQWSPDGQEIMFLSDAAGITNIWLMDADGSNRRNLSGITLGTDLVVESSASWSPDGTSILFQSMRDENMEIYTVSPDGSNLRNLTQNPATDMNPVWSPDGSMIAFQSDRNDARDVYVLTLATEELVNVSNSPSAKENNFIWAPDGSQLYFDSDERGNYDIYVVNRDGSEKRILIDNPDDDVDPQWVNP